MRLAVCLKQVPSRDVRIRVNAAGTWIREDDATWTLNEPDAYALEEALRVKERVGGEVVAVSVGPERVAAVLREALARGADRAIHVRTDQPSHATDPQQIASALAEALRDDRPDLVLTGLQSDDHGFGQVGVALAEHLSASHATIVMSVEPGEGRVRVKRELEGGWFQWVALPLPAVLTVQSGINQLRYATLRGIMAAKKKDLRVVTVPHVPPMQQIVRLSAPVAAKQAELLSGSAEEAATALAGRLRQSGVL